jgi:HK97 family phage prohead protease
MSEIEIRRAEIAKVAYPDRMLELIAVPYDEWTPVEYRGRIVEESFAPGAFGAVAMRARKFLVNMEHDAARWVGTVLELRADDPAGLRTKIKIRRGPEGDAALDDAADSLLGASVGFAVGPRGKEQFTDGRRRIEKAFLDHIALTAQPAYVGAEVVDVRTQPQVTAATSTPNLDRILAERRTAEYLSF